MLKLLINKFGIYSLLTTFMILLISCDNSTSTTEDNSALKTEIFGNWKIYRTCVEKNIINDFEGDYYDVGRKDTLKWSFLKTLTNGDFIYLYQEYSTVGEWSSSEAFSAPHWVFPFEINIPGTKIIFSEIVEITGINPLKGTITNKMKKDSTNKFELINSFEFVGEKY